jgi:hypothetical protein
MGPLATNVPSGPGHGTDLFIGNPGADPFQRPDVGENLGWRIILVLFQPVDAAQEMIVIRTAFVRQGVRGDARADLDPIPPPFVTFLNAGREASHPAWFFPNRQRDGFDGNSLVSGGDGDLIGGDVIGGDVLHRLVRHGRCRDNAIGGRLLDGRMAAESKRQDAHDHSRL